MSGSIGDIIERKFGFTVWPRLLRGLAEIDQFTGMVFSFKMKKKYHPGI
jgi:hypothetical protein